MSLNVVVLQGRLGADPDERHTSNGKAVTNFRIAVDHGYGDQKSTSWINITAWEKTATFVTQYFGKGDMILVAGRLQTREYEKDGERRTVVEVVAEKVEFAGGKTEEKSAPKTTAKSRAISDEDIPF